MKDCSFRKIICEVLIRVVSQEVLIRVVSQEGTTASLLLTEWNATAPMPAIHTMQSSHAKVLGTIGGSKW